MATANSFIGFSIICNKYLVSFIPLSVLLELRYFFSVVILFLVLLLSKSGFQFYLSNHKYTNREKFIYILMALSGGAVFNVIYMYGIRNTTAIATGMMSSITPILVVIFAFLILGQKIKKNYIFSALFVTIGICILNLQHVSALPQTITTDQMRIANFIVFLAMIPEALFIIFSKMLIPKVSPIMSAMMINGINLIVCTPFFLYELNFFPLNRLSIFEVFLCFLVGLFSGALFYGFYNSGISKISPQNAGLFVGVVPISAAILSIIFLKETFGVISLIGMCFVLISLYIGARAEDRIL